MRAFVIPLVDASARLPVWTEARDLLQAKGILFDDHLLTTSVAVDAFKQAHRVTTTPQVFSRDERIDGYGNLAKRPGEEAESVEYSYTPVLAVFGSTLLIALVLEGSILRHFKWLSICVLVILKLMDISSFAESLSKYDLIIQRWRNWAKVYPSVGLLVDLGFLTNPAVP